MSELINKIAKERYLRGDEKTMEDVYDRVASAVGEKVNLPFGPYGKTVDDSWPMRFYTLMRTGTFIPNTPTLSNAGTAHPMLSACFALPVNDSFEGPGGIDEAEINSRKIFRMGGGVGYNLSRLRPEGSPVQSTDGVASGPVSFMELFNTNIKVIKQGSRRRGAGIIILDAAHPDINKFIVCKTTEGNLSNVNISVLVTDDFMKDVTESHAEYQVGRYSTVMAHRFTFDLIVDGIWNNGEPGLLFYDVINDDNPNTHLYDIYTCNPCGEIPIGVNPETGGGEACNLGSINVSKFYNGSLVGKIDWTTLRNVIYDAVIFLDTIIDINEYPTPAIGEMALSTRKIGLGFMGLHDLLIMMDIPYDSEKGREIAETIMHFINTIAIEMSMMLAEYRGAYPTYEGSSWSEYDLEIRNSTVTCVAPTGTISLLADCSSGIEPHFNWVYERRNTVGGTYIISVPLFEEKLEMLFASMDDAVIKHILYDHYDVTVYTVSGDEWYIEDVDGIAHFGDIRKALVEHVKQECFEVGSIQHLYFLPESFKAVFKNARDINWKDHILMQATVQKFCDNSISKTINMPNNATKDDIREAIILAWTKDCKGLTMYREGSRNDVVMKVKEPVVIPQSEPVVINKEDVVTNITVTTTSSLSGTIDVGVTNMDVGMIENKESDEELPATRYKKQSGCGTLYITVSEKNCKPFDVFIECGGRGGCKANSNAIGRLISLLLKNNVPVSAIIRQLRKVTCDVCIKSGHKVQGNSCADIVGKILHDSMTYEEHEEVTSKVISVPLPYITTTIPRVCERCGHGIGAEKCYTCTNCGFSKCG